MNRLSVLIGLTCLVFGPALAADTTVTIKDRVNRGFPPDLVNYRLRADSLDAKRVRVYDASGCSLPVQVGVTGEGKAFTLSFVAELPPKAEVSYRISTDGEGDPPRGGPGVMAGAKCVVVTNALLGVRLPAVQASVFVPPVPASQLPAPILAFRSGSGDWLGDSRVLSDRPVKSLTVRLAATGPVYAEQTYEIEWAEGGFFRARIRVIDRVPLVQVREEYDLGRLDGTDFWELDVAQGWKPDTCEYGSTHGSGTVDMGGKVGPVAVLAKHHGLMPDSCADLTQFGLFREADKKAQPENYGLVGVAALHKGDWRRMNRIGVVFDASGQGRIRLGMSTRHATWQKDTASETSPYSMQEHDDSLSKTYGRRVWGLVLGHTALKNSEEASIANWRGFATVNSVLKTRMLYGVVGLDRYKDYVLDWPFGAGLTYPRVFLKAETLEATRQSLKTAPLPEQVKSNLLTRTIALGADEAVAVKRAADAIRELRSIANYFITCPAVSHHYTCLNYMTAAKADDVLSWKGLPEEQRRTIRSLLALVVYLHEEPDQLSYGAGSHSGNPNMNTARFGAGPCFLALVPDHPMFPAWRRHMAAYAEYKLGSGLAAGGAWYEYGTYHTHGYARLSNGLRGLATVDAPNMEQLYAYAAANWSYFMNLLTPEESRWRSRVIPGLANSEPKNSVHFPEAAGVLAPYDSKLAGELLWAWKANGANTHKCLEDVIPTDIALRDPRMRSRVYPGFGAVFRAHEGPESTYMLVRSGFNWSHWFIDQGHLILMSRGATLLPFQPYQYARYGASGGFPDKSFDSYNALRFGHPENELPYGWPDGNVLDHALGQRVQYAWVSTGFPEWYIRPGVAPTWQNTSGVPDAGVRQMDSRFEQKEGPFCWDRQIMFLPGHTAKGPNYFVLRDTTTGQGELARYLYLNMLGTKQSLKWEGTRLHADTEWPTKLDVLFLGPKPVARDEFECLFPVGQKVTGCNMYERYAEGEVRSPNWVDKDGTPSANLTHERRVGVRLPVAPNSGFAWVLYPRGEDDPLPQATQVAEGVYRVTHPEGTDTVFLAPRHMRYEDDDVVFEGAGGAIRVGPDTVTLALSRGAGRIGYKGHVLEGTGSFERTVRLADIKAGVYPVSTAPTAITGEHLGTTAEEVAEGVWRTVEGTSTRYSVDAPEPLTFAHGNVRIEAGRCLVAIEPEGIRFVVPDPRYAQLSVGGVGVRGVGPFDLMFTDEGILGRVDGKIRSLVTTWPEAVVRPMYHMDGVRYFAGWADDHSIAKGQDSPQFAVAFGVTDGPHEIRISEWTYPELPPRPPVRTVSF